MFSSRVRTEFFLDMLCREPYTATCSHDLPRRQRTPNWSLMDLTGDTDVDSAHRLLLYSGESEALFMLDNVLHEKSEEGA